MIDESFEKLLAQCGEEWTNFDHAACVPKGAAVLEMWHKVARVALNSNSAHRGGAATGQIVKWAEQAILRHVPAARSLEFVPGSGTLANRRAVLGALQNPPRFVDKGLRRDVVLCSATEHSSIVLSLPAEIRLRGYTVEPVPVNHRGVVKMDALLALLRKYEKRVALVSIHAVNNETGAVQPLSEIRRAVSEHAPQALLHSDFAQGLYLLFQMNDLPDLVTFTTYKIGGPHLGIILGTGEALPLRAEHMGTPDVAAIAAAAVAVTEAAAVLPQAVHHCTTLVGKLKDALKEAIPSARIVSPDGASPFILSVQFPRQQSRVLTKELGERGILTSSGSACASQNKSDGPSHVLRAMGYSPQDSYATLRLSLGGDNTEADVTKLVAALKEIISTLPVSKPEKKKKDQIRRTPGSVPVGGVKGMEFRPATAQAEIPCVEVDAADITRVTEYNVIKVSFGELSLKKENRGIFERVLRQHVKSLTRKLDPDLSIDDRLGPEHDRTTFLAFLVLHKLGAMPIGLARTVVQQLQRVSGTAKICPMVVIPRTDVHSPLADIQKVATMALRLVKTALDEGASPESTFAVRTRRMCGVTQFPEETGLINEIIGKKIGSWHMAGGPAGTAMTVNLKKADIRVTIEVRAKFVFVYHESYEGMRGLPAGSQGGGLALFTDGNIKSVAEAALAQISRGVHIDFVYISDIKRQTHHRAQTTKITNPPSHDESLDDDSSTESKMETGAGGVATIVDELNKFQQAPGTVTVLGIPGTKDMFHLPALMACSYIAWMQRNKSLLVGNLWETREPIRPWLVLKALERASGVMLLPSYFELQLQEQQDPTQPSRLPAIAEDVPVPLNIAGIPQLAQRILSAAQAAVTLWHSSAPDSFHQHTFDFPSLLRSIQESPAPVPSLGQTPAEVVLLLSGGIDSPVAGWQLLQSGFRVSMVHFTTDIDKSEVVQQIWQHLRKHGDERVGPLHIVPYERIQRKIVAVCEESYRTVMYKVLMLRIANRIAARRKALAVATGDAWGQVASQTPGNLRALRSFSDLPVLSPLLFCYKEQIIKQAQRIGTFDYSTCKGTEDCCVLFQPRSPALKAKKPQLEGYLQELEANHALEDEYVSPLLESGITILQQ
eukprot:TRINITY_DN6062_c0_g1_i1.p1 TRINITY_DN6062_c0_g1~~TRINITY_DN6062_c0_g1_i1.p1  ORF type:complete len:1118 (+),score=189.95 TRINITY_DN6062_c0_g1_i1:337-3690(+)